MDKGRNNENKSAKLSLFFQSWWIICTSNVLGFIPSPNFSQILRPSLLPTIKSRLFPDFTSLFKVIASNKQVWLWRGEVIKPLFWYLSLLFTALVWPHPTFPQFSRPPPLLPTFLLHPRFPPFFLSHVESIISCLVERESKHPRPRLRASRVGVGGGGEAARICMAVTLSLSLSWPRCCLDKRGSCYFRTTAPDSWQASPSHRIALDETLVEWGRGR